MTVGKFICSIVVNGYDSMSDVSQVQYAEMIDHAVRKSAHFCEYAMLGVLTAGVFSRKSLQQYLRRVFSRKSLQQYLRSFFPRKSSQMSRREIFSQKYLLAAWIWGTLYAATDEFHQLFVPGRYGMVLDVLLDSAGVLTGVLLVYIMIKVYKNFMVPVTINRQAINR